MGRTTAQLREGPFEGSYSNSNCQFAPPLMEAPDDRDVDLQQEAASIDALLAEIPGPITSVHEGRLVISKMVLENFKSYGGVKEIGPFHTSMSAVVGPNGSGKSNVIDALLFVFGKRATKLRLKKVSELIHKSRYVALFV
jgi:hypothetical protein